MLLVKNMKNLIKKVKNRKLSETIYLSISYLRGIFLSRHFDGFPLASVMGKIRVIKTNSTITIGDYVRFWPDVKIACVGKEGLHAKLQIGERTSIGDRTEIHCGKQVIIGDDVKISWDCVIMDRDYHALNNQQESLKPVIIEDNVWIGCRAIILKGVRIEKGAVVAAGSVVTKNVSKDTIVGGNPAVVIRKI